MRLHRLLTLVPLLCLAVPACKGGGNIFTGEGRVDHFVVEPAGAFSLEVGQTRVFTITALDRAGNPAEVDLAAGDFQVAPGIGGPEQPGQVTIANRDDVVGDARFQVVVTGVAPGEVVLVFTSDVAFFESFEPNREYEEFTRIGGTVRTRPVARLVVEPSAPVSLAVGGRQDFVVTALDAAGVAILGAGANIGLVATPPGFVFVGTSGLPNAASMTFTFEAQAAGTTTVQFQVGSVRSDPVALTVRAAISVPTGAQIAGPFGVTHGALLSTTCAASVGFSQPTAVVATSEAGGFLTLTSTFSFANVPVRGPYNAVTGQWRGEGDFQYNAGSGNPRHVVLDGTWRNEAGVVVFRGTQTDTYGTGATACSTVFDVVYTRQ